jgi:hypothetical protein
MFVMENPSIPITAVTDSPQNPWKNRLKIAKNETCRVGRLRRSRIFNRFLPIRFAFRIAFLIRISDVHDYTITKKRDRDIDQYGIESETRLGKTKYARHV